MDGGGGRLKLLVYWPLSEKLSSVQSLSHVRLLVTLWTVAHQAPPSMGFSSQEYWSGLPFHMPSKCKSLCSTKLGYLKTT